MLRDTSKRVILCFVLCIAYTYVCFVLFPSPWGLEHFPKQSTKLEWSNHKKKFWSFYYLGSLSFWLRINFPSCTDWGALIINAHLNSRYILLAKCSSVRCSSSDIVSICFCFVQRNDVDNFALAQYHESDIKDTWLAVMSLCHRVW